MLNKIIATTFAACLAACTQGEQDSSDIQNKKEAETSKGGNLNNTNRATIITSKETEDLKKVRVFTEMCAEIVRQMTAEERKQYAEVKEEGNILYAMMPPLKNEYLYWGDDKLVNTIREMGVTHHDHVASIISYGIWSNIHRKQDLDFHIKKFKNHERKQEERRSMQE